MSSKEEVKKNLYGQDVRSLVESKSVPADRYPWKLRYIFKRARLQLADLGLFERYNIKPGSSLQSIVEAAVGDGKDAEKCSRFLDRLKKITLGLMVYMNEWETPYIPFKGIGNFPDTPANFFFTQVENEFYLMAPFMVFVNTREMFGKDKERQDIYMESLVREQSLDWLGEFIIELDDRADMDAISDAEKASLTIETIESADYNTLRNHIAPDLEVDTKTEEGKMKKKVELVTDCVEKFKRRLAGYSM